MLRELRIKNYAVIEDLSLHLDKGLNALAGETGAGKSIIVDALSLALGERATAEVIRAGEDRALVEAVFDASGREDLLRHCEDAGIDVEDGWLVLKRELRLGGRSRAWVNGSPATATLTSELGRGLVDLHGQHDHQTLLHPGPQREILDAHAGAGDLARALRECWTELGGLRRRREQLEDQRARTEQRAEFLRHQSEEIEGAELEDPEEDLALAQEERRLAHAEDLRERSEQMHSALCSSDDSILDRMSRLRRELDALAKVDPLVEAELSELAESAYYSTQELGERLRAYTESIDLDPGKLELVRGRIDLLFRLKSRYGPTLLDVIQTAEGARGELETLDKADFQITELSHQQSQLAARLDEVADKLSATRRKAARSLAAEVNKLLPELGMPDGRFEVALEPRSAIAASGAEDVEFRVTLNPGFSPRPLAKVASGGELSRVMLALKTILAKLDRIPTLVFDEIDAGIGGIVGQKVAERLKAVSRDHQVFVITHLPQIAALADHHFLVTKRSDSERTSVGVAEVSGENRVRDIARMLGGDPERAASLEHARQLLGLPVSSETGQGRIASPPPKP